MGLNKKLQPGWLNLTIVTSLSYRQVGPAQERPLWSKKQPSPPLSPTITSSLWLLLKGRVLLVTLAYSGLSSSFCNVHNHGLTATDLANVSSGLASFVSASTCDPSSSSLILLGDLNAIEDHRAAFSLAAAAPTHERSQNNHKPAFWRRLLDKAIEIKYSDFSHSNLASNKLNSLTRGYWFTQPWLCTSLHVSASVLEDPVKLQLKKFSDHAPTSFLFRVSLPRHSQHPKIPHHVAKSLDFKNTSRKRCRVLTFLVWIPLLPLIF